MLPSGIPSLGPAAVTDATVDRSGGGREEIRRATRFVMLRDAQRVYLRSGAGEEGGAGRAATVDVDITYDELKTVAQTLTLNPEA